MTVSYKSLWQEVKQENEQLKAEAEQLKAGAERLREEHRREIEKLNAFITANRSDLAATRPIVDLAGIARHMRVARFTPQQWQQRGHLPPVDFPEIREPIWHVSTIRDQFVIPTGRIWYDLAEDEEAAAA